MLREYVTRTGGAISPELVFTDAAISGSSIVRPGFTALVEAVRAGLVDVVVTEDLSRIGRDIGNNDRTLKEFRKAGARLLAINDGIDTGQTNAKLLGAIKSAMGESYIDELRERTKRGMDGLFEEDMHTGGRVFGYRATPIPESPSKKRLVIDPIEAKFVRRIFEEYLAGHSQKEIAERLNADGVPSPRGGKWSLFTLRSMLRNDLYAGVVFFNRRRWERDSTTGKRNYVDRPRSEWRRKERPELRIVDAVTWADAQSRVRHREKLQKSGARDRGTYPLSGLVTCGVCGSAMTICGGGLYYECSGHRKGHGCTNRQSLRERDVRQWVVDKIRETVDEPGLLEQVRADWAANLGGSDRALKTELTERRAALTRTQGQISKLLDFVCDGTDTPQIRAKLAEKEDHAELQRATIMRLESQLSQVPVIPMVGALRTFMELLPDLLMRKPVEARTMLRDVLDGHIACSPSDAGSYSVRFTLLLNHLLQATNAVPAAGGLHSLGLVAGARFQPKRMLRVIEGICPKSYAETRVGTP